MGTYGTITRMVKPALYVLEEEVRERLTPQNYSDSFIKEWWIVYKKLSNDGARHQAALAFLAVDEDIHR